MTYKRRSFIKVGAGLMAGLAFTGNMGCSASRGGKMKSKDFGLQLYSLRDDMPKDPKGVLAKVASYGYKQIEGYEGGQGMFWGMKNTDFKMYMDDLGLDFVASHLNIDENFEQKAAQAAEIGMKYLICPSRHRETLDDFKRSADVFNEKGAICKKHGINFAYHNHEYSFKAIEGQFPQDIMMQNTDPVLVDFELDIYWIVVGGQDPIAWLEKYKNRFVLGHIKDRLEGATERGASCTLGHGFIDYPSIYKAAKKNGMKYFIVEQERYDEGTPLECIQNDAVYMKNLMG